jgi:hypothetical protein
LKLEGNPYYYPEKSGLEKVAELDFSSGIYEFDLTVVWTHGDEKKFYWASDSGCSCPSPFEDFHEFEQLQSGGFKQIRDELTRRFDGEGWGNYVKITELHPVIEKLHAISEGWND